MEIIKNIKIVTISEKPDLTETHVELGSSVWPAFMLHDPIGNKHWDLLFDWFSPFQLSAFHEGEMIAIANSIPLHWDLPVEELPEEGWDWAILKGVEDYKNGTKPNVLSALQIAIKKEYQGKGLSSHMVRQFKRLAAEHGLEYVIAPVRPNRKTEYPLQSIDQYISWEMSKGLPFDPWLRVHARVGGKIIKPCHRAMEIHGSLQDWENWTGMQFPDSGEYVVRGALSPVTIDRSRDKGTYIEPNVWVWHSVMGR